MLAIADGRDGQLTSFTEPSPYITTEELGRLAIDYLGLLDGATAVVLCGSLPDGLPEEIYGSFVSYATGAGVPVILDAGGNALRHAAVRGRRWSSRTRAAAIRPRWCSPAGRPPSWSWTGRPCAC